MQNPIIDVTSVFTAEQMFLQEKERLEKLVTQSKPAVGIDIVDQKVYRALHDIQMQVRNERITIEKARKDFTSTLDERKKFAIDRERELTTPLIEIEEAIKTKKELWDKEQERIKAEKEAEEMRVFKDRYDELMKYGVTTDLASLKAMSDDGFRMMADTYKKKWEEAEKIRLEQEAENQRIAQEAETKRQAELEEARKLKEENDKKAQENERIAQELAQKQKEIEDKQNELKRQEEEKKAQEEEEARAKKFNEDQEKYKKWLADNWWTEENKLEYTTTIRRNPEDENDRTVILYKKVAEYKL